MKSTSRSKPKSPKSAAKARPAVSGASIYQLKIILEDVKPAIWRRVAVPGHASLRFLHAVIQLAMGWTNSHLHQFIIGDRCFSDTSMHFSEFQGDPEILEESKNRLCDLGLAAKEEFGYEYDFGDGWIHVIRVEGITAAPIGETAAAGCLTGARACPPEDCGGPWGYEDLLEALRNPKHKEHQSMKEWIGGSFDPEAFQLASTDKHLQKLKWPQPSVEQLGTLLMARDRQMGRLRGY